VPAGKIEMLLVGRNALLVLDFCLNVDFEGDGFASGNLDKDLYSTVKAEDIVESRPFLDVVI
jgi:hypothetical protein